MEIQTSLAAQLSRAGHHQEAVQTFHQVLLRHPDDVEAMRMLSGEYEMLGQFPQAVEILQRLVRTGKDVIPNDRWRLLLLLSRLGRTREVQASLATLDTSKLEPDETVELAGIVLDMGDMRKAAALLEGLSPKARSGTRAREMEATILARTGRHREAAQILQTLRRDLPRRDDLAWFLVDQLTQAGEKPQALELARTLARTEHKPDRIVFAAQLALELDDLPLAQSLVERIPEPSRPAQADLVLAEIMARRGEIAHRAALLASAMARHPRDALIWRAAVAAFLDADRVGAAMDALARRPTRAATIEEIELIIRVHRLAGDEVEAVRQSHLLADRLPPRPEDRVAIARFFLGQGDEAMARDILASVPPHAAASRSARLAALWVDVLSGRKDDALVSAIQALVCRFRPDDPEVFDALDLLLTLGDSRGTLDGLARTAPRARTDMYRRAVLRARAELAGPGRPDAVCDALSIAQSLAPTDLPVPTELVALEAELGDVDGALAMAQNAATVSTVPAVPAVPALPTVPTDLAVLIARLTERWTPRQAQGQKALLDLWAHPPAQPQARLDLAEGLEDLGELARARQLLEATPATSQTRLRKALLVIRDDTPFTPLAKLIGALDALAREPIRGADEVLAVAETALLLGDTPHALALLETLPSAARQSYRYFAVHSRAEYARQEVGIADRELAQMRAQVTELPSRRLGLIDQLIALRRIDEANVAFAALPRRLQECADGLRMRTGLAIMRRERPESLALSGQLVVNRASDPEAASLQAQALLLNRRFEAARLLYEKLLSRWPCRDDLVLGRAQALLGLDRVNEALAITLGARKTDEDLRLPVPMATQLACVQALDQSDRAAQALPILQRLLAKLPGDRELLEDEAVALARLDRFGEALAAEREALAAGRATLDERVTLAEYMFWVDGPGSARQELEAVLAIDPCNPEALATLGRVLAARPRTLHRALDPYQRLLAVDPENPGRVGYASVLLELGQIDGAERECTIFQKMQPGNRDAAMLRAAILLARNRPAEADSILGKLETERPLDPVVLVARAGLATVLGQTHLAQTDAYLRRAKALAPARPSVIDADATFRRRDSIAFQQEDSSDTLHRAKVTAQVARVCDHRLALSLDLVQNDVSRLGLARSWTDLVGRVVWNTARGSALALDLTAGATGASTFDVLGGVEGLWADCHGFSWTARIFRNRIDDSPESLRAGLTSSGEKIAVGVRQGRLDATATATHDRVSDGNDRELFNLVVGYLLRARLQLTLNLEQRFSAFEPVIFDLYFAPSSYFSGGLGLVVTPLVVGAWRLTLRGQLLFDDLDGGPGRGYNGGLRIERRVGRRSLFSAELAHTAMTASRKLGTNQPFTQDLLKLAYETRF